MYPSTDTDTLIKRGKGGALPMPLKGIPLAIAANAALAMGCGVGFGILRMSCRRSLDPRVVALKEEGQENIARALSNVIGLLPDESVARVLAHVSDLLGWNASDRPCAMHHMARLNEAIVAEVRAGLDVQRRGADADTFRAHSIALDEDLPHLRGVLDNLLHNHLLARGG